MDISTWSSPMQSLRNQINYFADTGNFESEEWRRREMSEWFLDHINELKNYIDSVEEMQLRYGNAVLALEALRQWPVIAAASTDSDGAWARNLIDSGLSARLRK